jgi:hypothetical protein
VRSAPGSSTKAPGSADRIRADRPELIRAVGRVLIACAQG